jgi:hypothetical protein
VDEEAECPRSTVSIPDEQAQAFITTDLDSNQITAFHLGAMNHSYRIKRRMRYIDWCYRSDSREGMLQHAEQFKAAESRSSSIRQPCRCSPATISSVSSRSRIGWH